MYHSRKKEIFLFASFYLGNAAADPGSIIDVSAILILPNYVLPV